MNEVNIVIVDEDADFCRRLDGCLRERLQFPVSVHDYTDPQALSAHEKREDTSALLISEGALQKTSIEGFPRVIVLSEGLGVEVQAPTLRRVNKYRALSGLFKEITEMVMDAGLLNGQLFSQSGKHALRIAFFSPLSRCLQTTSALTLAQLCAEQRKTLYLGLEPFPGHIACSGESGGLSELLYYYECEPEKIALHVEKTRVQLGALHVIPPAQSCTDVLETEAGRWDELFTRISTETDYEVIVTDFSVCVRGLTDLLRGFERIVTIERDDGISGEKLHFFDRMLKRSGHEDLRAKNTRLTLPVFPKLPADPARYGEGQLADYWRQVMHREGFLSDDDRT
ncbi:MAG: hypothetical protein K6G16_07580 [Lachnospiraceae bacterium]|nr:hypothetical protein [Lachnospiraceae bacterium]